MTPRVAVIVPCFNYGRYLAEAVESVLTQTLQELELVVVDDGSTDDSLEVANGLAARDARVSVLAQANAGQPAYARNNGIARTSAPYVLCLDADDSLQPRFLEACVDALDRDPSVSVAYGDQQDFGDDEIFHRHPDYDPVGQPYVNQIGTASLYRRTAWEAVGGYATNVRGYEDWDFWVGCLEHGHGAVRVPDAVFNYRVKTDGLYSTAHQGDLRLKAQLLLNHRTLYTAREIAWAEAALAGDPAAALFDQGVGRIPRLPPTGIEGLRRHAVAASAEELIAVPSLLDAYAAAVPAEADVTLVVHVGSAEALDELARRVDGVAADMIALPELGEADVAAVAHAVLTAGAVGPALARLPRLELAA